MRIRSNPADNLYTHSFLNIRRLKKSDLPALEWDGEYIHYRRLFKELYKNATKGNSILWVIELKDTGLIGQLFVQLTSPRQELADGNLRAYFYSFRIKEIYRECGYGSKLLDYAEEDLRKKNYKFVTLNVSKRNNKVLRFYTKRGYKIIANEPGRWSYIDHLGTRQDVDQPSWRLEKKIEFC
jgi:ribosomal protein S18 acetylase RimI-like enzyme